MSKLEKWLNGSYDGDIKYIYHISIMRTLIDLPDPQVEELNALSQARKVSRAELIRQAVAVFLSANKSDTEQAFGLWAQHGVDGVAYQKKVRSEW